MTLPNPKRHLELEVRIGADTVRDLIRMLNWLEFEMSSREQEVDTVGLTITTGGYGYGGSVKVDVTAIDHDTYFEQVNAWLDEHKDAELEARKHMHDILPERTNEP